MPDSRLRIAVIIGSTREGRFGPTIADWFTRRARRRNRLDIDVVDLADTALPVRIADERSTAVRELGARFAAADAFVVVTPEYNGSYPASVKIAIDWCDREFSGKPVAFVSYGRESGGRNAVAHLREVFTELNAVAIRDGVALPCYWDRFAADGSWPKTTGDLDEAVADTLDQLAWWGFALRDARSHEPCPY